MWIKKLVLENFQSHENTVLELHPNFNCIVGVSNVGKTAIARALDFILFGKWDSSWVNVKATTCKIILETNTGVIVTREKGPNLNKYILTVPNNQTQVYEAFGIGVPEPVSKVLQMFFVEVDNESLNLNLSNQLDSMFLLSKPGSFKAKVFGMLSGAHYLDYSIKELNKDKKTASTEITLLNNDISSLERQLAQFVNLSLFEEHLGSLELQEQTLYIKQQRIEKLKALFLRVKSWKRQYDQESQKEAILDPLSSATMDTIAAFQTRLTHLYALKHRLHKNNDLMASLRTAVSQREIDIHGLQTSYLETLAKVGKCPTCLSELTPSTLASVAEHLAEHVNA